MYSVFSASAVNPGTSGTFSEFVEAQPPQGTCDVAAGSPNTVHALTGVFQPQFSGKSITIDGTAYVFTYTDSTHGTIASGPGTLSNKAWSFGTISAEEVAQNQAVNDAGGVGAGWESDVSTWKADVDIDASSGGNPLKLYSTSVLAADGSQPTKNVIANDQGSPVSYAANVALEAALSAAVFSGTCDVSNASPNVITALTGTFLPAFNGKTIIVNGVQYVFTFTDSTHGTLASGPGTLTGVNWSFPASGRQCSRTLTSPVAVKAN